MNMTLKDFNYYIREDHDRVIEINFDGIKGFFIFENGRIYVSQEISKEQLFCDINKMMKEFGEEHKIVVQEIEFNA